ncbi:hypothetical protein [uncultured Slackia sp.]|uniref:hypothetical protein n=1 Tax=uncultured Slackia sp. TaxID=665903 RepID=UPI0025E27E2E|nr:hypothetical protein [uncultured Slackia sp.]
MGGSYAIPVPEQEKFKKVTKLKNHGTLIHLTGPLPGSNIEKGSIANEKVTAKDSEHSRVIMLLDKMAEGGEGAVFRTNIRGYVAKIYRREKLTTDKLEKLSIMISKPINCVGVCFPEALIFNSSSEFVGYLMREAQGVELGKSIFQPKLLLQKFPKWTRKDSIDLCITILEKFCYLNERRVIVGDINPGNILVKSPSEVYFVDCDSYQIEGYPCPVGTDNFTAPEVGGREFDTFLRTKQMENFAIATLLFMIMLPGKPPYSAVGGESPSHNIKEGIFPYPHKEKDTDKTPPGKWGFIWSHMSYDMRLAFFETFKKGEEHFEPQNRYYPDEWIEIFKKYRHSIGLMMQRDPMAMDVFPTRLKLRECKKCGELYAPDPEHYSPFCSKCDKAKKRAPLSNKTASNNHSEKKLCPFCGENWIPANWSYCDDCKDKVYAHRECVNCKKLFPVSTSLHAWEEKTGLKRNKCDVCRNTGCRTTPCIHAAKPSPSASVSSRTSASASVSVNKRCPSSSKVVSTSAIGVTKGNASGKSGSGTPNSKIVSVASGKISSLGSSSSLVDGKNAGGSSGKKGASGDGCGCIYCVFGYLLICGLTFICWLASTILFGPS